METMILLAYSFMLFASGMMLRDLAGRKDRKGKKGKIFFACIILVATVVLCTVIPWEHWWHAAALVVGSLIFGWLVHYGAT